MRCKSWAFLFHKGCKMAGMCLICALLSKKCLAVCLTLCLASDARRDVLGDSGRGNLRAVWVWLLHVPDGVRRGLSHHKDRCSVCRSACWCVVAAVPGGPAVVLVVLSLPNLWMISPAECRCSVQHGQRSGCVLLGIDTAGVGCCLCCHAGHGTM